jgi:UDP-glucose 4-epimerase
MILVTGGDGYIGSNCVLKLLESGKEVVVFDNHSTGHAETGAFFAKNFVGRFSVFEGDLLEPRDLKALFSEYDIDAVIHFAAFSQVAESMSDPAKYWRNNVVGTMNLLDAMRDAGVGKIVFSSTAATYGEPEYVPIDEKHPQRPINPYGQTKLAIEQMMDSYDRAYGIRSVRLRYFNVVGTDQDARIGEWHDPETHLIPNILKSLFEEGREFTIFGDDYDTRDGTCIRDYVNVLDLVDAHLLALEYLDEGGKTDFFNLGTADGYTVKEVFETCRRVTGKDIPVRIAGRRPGDPAVLVADNLKAKTQLCWVPRRTLENSIRSAYAWEKRMHKR